jgi:hypothetical protein
VVAGSLPRVGGGFPVLPGGAIHVGEVQLGDPFRSGHEERFAAAEVVGGCTGGELGGFLDRAVGQSVHTG